ncbi:hypothetical protein SNE40_018504 [Patella caerulea]|uniref:Uncharacterized protein n=1 Tax=Patella caerulea TaxID=87958 RepID=A0AAN8P403_PATCE
MAARPASGGAASISSCAGIPVISAQTKHTPLPEEWTLPHEWSIEKREIFQNWKMDIQKQIANLAGSLESSLSDHPHPTIGNEFNYSDAYVQAEIDTLLQEKERLAGNTLLYGLARVPHPQKQ